MEFVAKTACWCRVYNCTMGQQTCARSGSTNTSIDAPMVAATVSGSPSDQQPDPTREWANTPATKGHQKPKPVGDKSRWEPRYEGAKKRINNFRKGVRHAMKAPMNIHDEALADPSSTDAQIRDACQRLYLVYRRLNYLDKCHIMIETPEGLPEHRIHMTEDQKVRNEELRVKEAAPYG